MFGPIQSNASTLTDEQVSELRGEAQQFLIDKKPEDALAKIVQVIIARPADLAARFFRSQILVSLGRGEEVRQELELMTTLKIPQADKDKAKQLIEAIDKMGRRFSGSFTLKAGLGYGNNVSSWPNGGETTSSTGVNAGMPDPIYKKYDRIDDTIRSASVSFSGSYFLNDARSFKTNFGFSSSYKNAADTVSLDSKLFSVRVGLQSDFDSGMTVKGNLSKTSLNRVNDKAGTTVNSDISITGMDVELSQKLTDRLTLGYKLASSQNRNTKITKAKDSDANSLAHSVYLGSPIGGTAYGRLTGTINQSRAAENRQANKKKADKDSKSLSGLLVKVLPHNQRIIATVSFSQTSHLNSANSINNKKRLDKTQSATLGYTIKGEEIWSPLGDISFAVDGTYSKTSSNQASARVHAKTITLSVSRKFEM
ncbi:hypothetical protein HIMB100_00000920 [SAR116 cluster alpha proteobacterium HIMB100]|nr:hypothetical protein HIMB100_00000920 [SAR116 cluster alpha proteobacterium HIMB100]